MLFSKEIVISEQLVNYKAGILENISSGMLPENSFLICINKASKNLMDIYFCKELVKPYVKTEDLLIIAIAKDKTDAKNICAEILQNYLKSGNGLDEFGDIANRL